MSKKAFWKGLFSFSLTERKGFVLLFFLVFTLKLSFLVRDWYQLQAPVPDAILKEFRAYMDSLERDQTDTVLVYQKSKYPTRKEKPVTQIRPSLFNPNTITAEELKSFGLSERLVSTWINFRNAGGKFSSSEDLSKLYFMDSTTLAILRPHIQIKSEEQVVFSKEEDTTDHLVSKPEDSKGHGEITNIDINQASNEEWQELPGIGPGYAGRIIKFREALGGFASIDQIGETWHLPDSVFQSIKAHLIISPVYRKIAINKGDEETLAKHPYLSKKQAKIIIKYRNNYGAFSELNDLLKTGVIKEEDLQKIGPYLELI